MVVSVSVSNHTNLQQPTEIAMKRHFVECHKNKVKLD
jgi:hypothetical protein